MKTYSRVYFSLCLYLVISGRSRTQRKLNPREKLPIHGMWYFSFCVKKEEIAAMTVFSTVYSMCM